MNNENGLTPSQLAERNAILVTEIEKCRELSGCPADVDLQDWVKMLVSELSVVEEIHNSAVFITDELYDASPKEVQGIIRSLACMKMPAYASLVAGIKADGVTLVKSAFEMHIQSASCYQDEIVGMESALSIACQVESQLREGADK
ncbi:hypothetical protein OUI59_20875 [Klebsiella variicola subsp. tropica]|uniref:hypothetical protein n=1 Tax=Klebsiella variicola TaxID=244366 RepID=UPI0022836D8C|nr:hypothetical protein [Klebsiella variicola]WAL51228.1 hypothetical protein OUI59_20875 [Klebsiella variicola subsp. tropica]